MPADFFGKDAAPRKFFARRVFLLSSFFFLIQAVKPAREGMIEIHAPTRTQNFQRYQKIAARRKNVECRQQGKHKKPVSAPATANPSPKTTKGARHPARYRARFIGVSQAQ